MSLASYGGRLLSLAGRLVSQCCCGAGSRYDCIVTGTDSCGRPTYQCVPTPSGPYDDPTCNNACPTPEPASCSPPCGPCEQCEGCECQSVCSECEECVDGECVPKCGPCESCIGGECYPCPAGYACVGGVCIPPPPPPPPPPPLDKWYCCYDEPASEYDPPPTTTSCQIGPCGKEEGGVFVAQPERTAGGPYDSSDDCSDACRPHSCKPSVCCTNSCQPDQDGEYLTKDKCVPECLDDPTTSPCALGPANPFTASGSGGGSRSFSFSIDQAPNRPICVAYSTRCPDPIRVQIWAATVSEDGCTLSSTRVIKMDSQWRCDPDCQCEDLPENQACQGAPKGILKWRTKQSCITEFEVRVLTICEDTEWEIAVSCGECEEVDDLLTCGECCDCSDNCTVTDPVIDDQRDADLQGLYRAGFTSAEPANWGGVQRSVEWKEGYPEKIHPCYFWWSSINACTTVIFEGNVFAPRLYASTQRTKWRLYGCVQGSFEDVTDKYTTNGPFEQLTFITDSTGVESALGGVPCPEPPPSDFIDPIIDCNPLP